MVLRLTRGMVTLVGVASAVVLVWLAAQVGDDSTADYWALYGLVAAAGLVMALSQLLGGWTKWGWPRLSGSVFVLGFLPALVVAVWVLGAGQPGENWLQQHVVDWSETLGLGGWSTTCSTSPARWHSWPGSRSDSRSTHPDRGRETWRSIAPAEPRSGSTTRRPRS